MPHTPDLRSHADHDPELVAAYAAGDAAGTELETAAALVAGCAECATLHHDLRAIAAATASLPAPARARDFRLTPEQAAALRPAGWRGLVAALAGPRFRFAAPLGTGLAALGLAGVLLGSLGSVPLGAGGAASVDSYRNGAAPAAGGEATAPAYAAPSMQAAAPVAEGGEGLPQASMAPGASPAPQPAASPKPVPAASEPGRDTAAGSAAGASGAVSGVDDRTMTEMTPRERDAVAADGRAPAGQPLVLLGGLAFAAGVLLAGARVASRRLR